MLRKKKTEIEISVEKGNKEITQTGKAMIDQINDPEFKKALIKASSDSDSDVGDPTKFTLLENLHNRETIDYYTYWKKEQETEQVNRLQTWQRLMPLVFGDSEIVRKCQEIVKEHVKDAMVNRHSLKGNGVSALVYAVKQDTGMIQADKQIATFLKGR